jgi:hypothetical protein
MQNKKLRVGPLALTTSVANIFNPGTTTGGTNSTGSPYANLFALIYHIKLVDKGGNGSTVNLFIGATGGSAAGTEFCKAYPVPANGTVDFYEPSGLRFDVGDFLTGAASAGTEITILLEGEQGIA